MLTEAAICGKTDISAASNNVSMGRLIPASRRTSACRSWSTRSPTFAPPTYARAVPIDIAAALGED